MIQNCLSEIHLFGKENQICGKCLKELEKRDGQKINSVTSEQPVKRGIVKIIGGIISTLAGLIIYLWLRGHSPHMGFGQMLMKYDTYIIKEPVYSIIVVLAAIFC